MNDLMLADYSHLIDRAEDRSHGVMSRVRVFFKNGWQLSIIRGYGSYGGENGLFEAMPVNPALPDNFEPVPGIENREPIGCLSVSDVNALILKVGSLPRAETMLEGNV